MEKDCVRVSLLTHVQDWVIDCLQWFSGKMYNIHAHLIFKLMIKTVRDFFEWIYEIWNLNFAVILFNKSFCLGVISQYQRVKYTVFYLLSWPGNLVEKTFVRGVTSINKPFCTFCVISDIGDAFFCRILNISWFVAVYNTQRRIYNPVKYLWWSIFAKIVNDF